MQLPRQALGNANIPACSFRSSRRRLPGGTARSDKPFTPGVGCLYASAHLYMAESPQTTARSRARAGIGGAKGGNLARAVYGMARFAGSNMHKRNRSNSLLQDSQLRYGCWNFALMPRLPATLRADGICRSSGNQGCTSDVYAGGAGRFGRKRKNVGYAERF